MSSCAWVRLGWRVGGFGELCGPVGRVTGGVGE